MDCILIWVKKILPVSLSTMMMKSRLFLLLSVLVPAVRALKVIGAGTGRTGTDSLRVALNDLGFGPTYHMFEVLGVPGRAIGDAHQKNHVDLWPVMSENFGETESHTWDDLFEGYGSAVDIPPSVFAVQLAKKYPKAKVILTVRSSAEQWHDSITGAWCRFTDGGMTDWVDQAFYDFRNGPYFALFSSFERRFMHQNAALGDAYGRALGGEFESTLSMGRICRDREYAIKFYKAWNKYIQKKIPKKRLLVLETGDPKMAEKLGKFLGLDKATMDTFVYPKLNSRQDFEKIIYIRRMEAVLSIIGPFSLLFVVVRKLLREQVSDDDNDKERAKKD